LKENTILTTQELSNYLKLNEKTVLKMAQAGELPGFKIGNQWRFYLSAIDEYLQDKLAKSPNYDLSRIVQTADIMPLSRLVDESSIELGLKSDNRNGILYELARIAQDTKVAICAEHVFEHLKKREDMLSTAIGNGVAIPHPRNPDDELFTKPSVIIGRSIEGVDFSSPDGKKVHLFFMTCAPDVILHLKLLSKIARLFENKDIFPRFMSADSKNEIIKILLEIERISLG
jgi:excisionase family DNA binding protein